MQRRIEVTSRFQDMVQCYVRHVAAAPVVRCQQGIDVLYQVPQCLTRGGFPKLSDYDSLGVCGRFAVVEG